MAAAVAALCGLSTLAAGQQAPANAPFQIVPLAPHQQGAEPRSPNETHPNAKTLASQIALALTTYSADEGPEAIAARLPAAAAGLAATFYVPGTWSAGRIVYPQLGGLEPNKVSVMVVVEQLLGAGNELRVEWRTLDVRLKRVDGGSWQFDALASDGGDRVSAPATLSAEALAVLNDPRIELPDSARWDIYSGKISPNLLRVMARMADRSPYGVITLSTGHPWEVFGTDKQSDHSRGRAMDIYRLGNTLTIDDHARGSRHHQFVQWLFQQPDVRQIGSPWELDAFEGPGGRSFTDSLHQDHIHIAVVP